LTTIEPVLVLTEVPIAIIPYDPDAPIADNPVMNTLPVPVAEKLAWIRLAPAEDNVLP
jgi:hypothetical protein